MKFGVRSLVAETKKLTSSFLTLSSKIIAKSPEFTFLNISCSPLQEISTYFENCHKLCFRVFLEIMKNGLKYLVAGTPSIVWTLRKKEKSRCVDKFTYLISTRFTTARRSSREWKWHYIYVHVELCVIMMSLVLWSTLGSARWMGRAFTVCFTLCHQLLHHM